MTKEDREYIKQLDLYIAQMENAIESCKTVIAHNCKQFELLEKRIVLEQDQIKSYAESIELARANKAKIEIQG